jgi:hypothetical protein
MAVPKTDRQVSGRDHVLNKIRQVDKDSYGNDPPGR